MSVTDYEAMFSELSHYALMILPTDAKRVRRFVAGLHSSIQSIMAREVDMGTSYELVVEIARRIKGVRQRSQEQISRDKLGQFRRGQPSRPTYPALPPPRGALVRPYFSAMPESSYHPPTIQGSSSGYSGHQGQTLGQQSTVLRGCFEFRDLSHVRRFCPRLRGKVVQQGQQPMISSPVAIPAVRPSRGEGQLGRSRPRGGGRLDVVASDAVITFIISICGRESSVLVDPRSTYLYVSSLFAHFLGVPRESLGTLAYVSTPIGDSIVVDQIYRSCIVTFCGYATRSDLLLLDMIDFEIILGNDWLSHYHAIFYCHAVTVTLGILELLRLEWKSSFVSASSRVISFLKARHMVEKGCLAYLAYVRDTTTKTPTIDSVPVVREFSDVFPSDLPSMPPDRDIDFCIDLAPVTQPISIPL
ncbi:uncharacterized protein [Nicotiana tomentosiformis]|uniref:uncharacterized protein n=1 Tax=Nicotiana tomentosiformis TaxID=4098 RepID=UPI00388C5B49